MEVGADALLEGASPLSDGSGKRVQGRCGRMILSTGKPSKNQAPQMKKGLAASMKSSTAARNLVTPWVTSVAVWMLVSTD